MRSGLVVALALAACSDHTSPPAPAATPPAGGSADRPRGAAAAVRGEGDVRPPPGAPAARGEITITLRSTPSGAIAAIDGVPVGTTPTYWRGVVDDQAHDFTFTRPGYDVARYKFVPITSGVVHARLEPISAAPDDGDAGVH